jgi:hypothetical protein
VEYNSVINCLLGMIEFGVLEKIKVEHVDGNFIKVRAVVSRGVQNRAAINMLEANTYVHKEMQVASAQSKDNTVGIITTLGVRYKIDMVNN